MHIKITNEKFEFQNGQNKKVSLKLKRYLKTLPFTEVFVF